MTMPMLTHQCGHCQCIGTDVERNSLKQPAIEYLTLGLPRRNLFNGEQT